jgi:hypothetical protein
MKAFNISKFIIHDEVYPIFGGYFRGYCSMVDLNGNINYYITNKDGYIKSFSSNWTPQDTIFNFPTPLEFCVGIDELKSFYIVAYAGVYQYDRNFHLIKSYNNFIGFYRIYYFSGNIYAIAYSNYGFFNFTTNLTLNGYFSLPKVHVINSIAGIGNKLFLGIRDTSSVYNYIYVFMDNILVNSWKACNGIPQMITTSFVMNTINALLFDSFGNMLYHCYPADTGIQELHLAIENSSVGIGYYSTNSTFSTRGWPNLGRIYGLYFDANNHLVILGSYWFRVF